MSADMDSLLSAANLAQLYLTHVGWSDYFGSIGAWHIMNIPFAWQVDELSFHQALSASVEVQTGACCIVATGTCLPEITAVACSEQSGRFDGVGVSCGEVVCQTPCPIPFADADRDGDVDISDFAFLQRCYTGPDDPGGAFDASSCECFDRGLDVAGDDDIDVHDLAVFLGCMAGADLPPVPTCDPGP
jgi:hypothetical protein